MSIESEGTCIRPFNKITAKLYLSIDTLLMHLFGLLSEKNMILQRKINQFSIEELKHKKTNPTSYLSFKNIIQPQDPMQVSWICSSCPVRRPYKITRFHSTRVS